MRLLTEETISKYTKTVGKRTQIDEIIKPIFLIQRLLGQQTLDPSWTWRRYIWNQLFTVFLLLYVILGTFEILSQITDIKTIAEAYYTLIICSIFAIKYLLFVGQRGTLQKLYVTAKTDLFDLIKQNSEEKASDVLDKGKSLIKLLFALITFPCIAYLVIPLCYYAGEERVTLSKTTSILMPMTSPFYEIGLILHMIFMFNMAFSILVIDVWFVFLMFMLCMASDSLSQMLNVKQNNNETDQTYSIRLNDVLRQFHKAHQKQTKYLSILSVMYKWASLVPLLQVFLFVCILLLLMSEGFDWAFASNILPTFVQIFAYNWYGEQIKIKTVNLNMALLEFDWTKMQLKDKRSYYIIMTYMNKEFGIKTAVGNDLSLFTMTSVFKASYQTYAVLNTMKD
uniref:Odorant receptor n=1 Tax=Dendrolimus punctatus TaxID=238572 RepID=A0A2K8GL34_9NEOP|nr:Odorant Receptor 1-2 [Dendrolimus punctatus]